MPLLFIFELTTCRFYFSRYGSNSRPTPLMDFIGLTLALLLGLALVWVACVLLIARQLTHPPKRGDTWALARNAPANPAECRFTNLPAPTYSTWTFNQPDAPGLYEVWDIPGLNPAGPDLIFTHGWGDSRVVSLPRIAPFLQHCRRVILWDLPAHGDQPFDPRHAPTSFCALGTREVRTLIALADTVSEHRARPVILAGFSLGAGISIAAAAEIAHADAHARIIAVIAEAPYRLPQTPAARVMHLRGIPHRLTLTPALHLLRLFRVTTAPAGWLRPGGSFDRATLAAKLSCPLLIIHSDADQICPLADATAISDAAGAKATFIRLSDSGHTQTYEHERSAQRAAAAIADFIAALPRS